jgi:hypothetical protein
VKKHNALIPPSLLTNADYFVARISVIDHPSNPSNPLCTARIYCPFFLDFALRNAMPERKVLAL